MKKYLSLFLVFLMTIFCFSAAAAGKILLKQLHLLLRLQHPWSKNLI